MVSGANTPTASGGRFAGGPTVTVKVWVAGVFEPPMSVAVTVTVDVPSEIGHTVTVEPVTSTAATDGDDDDARYVNASPSGSWNAPATGTARGPSSTWNDSGASVPTATGGRFASPTMTSTPAEQLLVVSTSPSTGVAHAP